MACRILVPRPETEPGPQQWKCRVLTTGPPGNSPKFEIKSPSSKIFHNAMRKINFIHKTLILSLINNEFNEKKRSTKSPRWVDLKVREPNKKVRGIVLRKLNTLSVLSWEPVTYVLSASTWSHTNSYQNIQERRINVAYESIFVRNDFQTNCIHNSLELGIFETLQEISWWYWPPNWDWGWRWREGEFASRAAHAGEGKKII